MRRSTLRPIYLLATLTIGAPLGALAPAAPPSAFASAPPRIELGVGSTASPIAVLDRDPFLVDARGFQNGEPMTLQANFPTYRGLTVTETRTGTANASGALVDVVMTAPPGARAGWAVLTATGRTSKRQATGRVDVVYRPSITLNTRTTPPGKPIRVAGQGFVSQAPIRLAITISTASGTQVLSQTVPTTSGGSFASWLVIPGYTRPATYTITATDTVGGFTRTARLTVIRQPSTRPTSTPRPRPTATPVPSLRPTYHASVGLYPGTTLPNQHITVIGLGFLANARVAVSTALNLRDGTTRSITKYPLTNGRGAFTVSLRVPYKTAPGVYTLTAATAGVQAGTQLRVLPRAAHPRNLGFRWISLWYHTVRQSTGDVLIVQATPRTKLGIWTHVVFPSGKHFDYYADTNRRGRWHLRFTIPPHSVSRNSHQAYIALQLWHGTRTTQAFISFTIV